MVAVARADARPLPAPRELPRGVEATRNTPGKWMMARIGEVGVGRAVWLNVDYQTVRRLRAAADHSLFTVRTYVEPRAAIQDPEVCDLEYPRNVTDKS